ncbi:tRNA 2-selenouridine synthase [Salinivirga cyanobacteriivorans]|uniref:tRNA 2-selenouridine synthase n=1 Tax=Salinivirga cyanobacteriivorans TaxID=1307839 RepID=A0A0S2I1L4_9BACT|nr:tRNA 2-selenouridine(34) synthase MnmH [Salinivirga cyanobacteriivorans]ALO16209.1 tRNA 2-selenouridine synthase [Salinivirga cyanobacteriivorans]
MPKEVSITHFLNHLVHVTLIDVRTPAEFEKGHIPGAVNIPLFSNKERAHVGTVYKQESRDAAIELGYQYVNPRLKKYIAESEKVAPDGNVVVYCWRGGMRSHAFAKHLKKNGFKEVYVIEHGYKAYRNLAVNNYTEGDLRVLGGYTGSGKTHILHEIAKRGEQVIDLEGLANHKGSAFGNIGLGAQPTTEQFANNLYWEWHKLDFSKPIWIEDESVNIGDVNLPVPLFRRMRQADLFFLEMSKAVRAKLLVEEYTVDNKEKLASAIQRIRKRLGTQNTKTALLKLQENNFYEVALIALGYYDKYYKKGMEKRNSGHVQVIKLKNTNALTNAKQILKLQYV